MPARSRPADAGFSLVELLVVVVILGVLAATVVIAVGQTGDEAKANSCKFDEKTVETALESYKAEFGAYPTYVDQSSFTALTTTHHYMKEAPASSEAISWTTSGAVSGTGPGC